MSKALQPSFNDIRDQLIVAARRTAVNPGIEGYKPQDHQIKFHKSEAFIKLFLGGNRAGKTVAGATDIVWKAIGRHPYNQKHKGPLRLRAVGGDFEEGIKRIILPEIAKWVPPSELIKGSWEESYAAGARTLTFANGSFIEFLSNDQEVAKHAGTSRHHVWFDEEPDEAIFNENLLRLLDAEGQCAITMTPLIDMSWTYDRLYLPALEGGKLKLTDGQDFGYIDVIQASTLDNVHINAAMISIITEGMSEDERMARTDGKYFSYSGTIYSNAIQPSTETDSGTYIDPIVGTDTWDIMRRKGWEFFGMLDHGLTNPTAYYVAAANERGAVVIFDEYYKAGNIIKDNSREILSMNERLDITRFLKYIVADPSINQKSDVTGTSKQAEYAEHGVYLTLGNNDVTAGIQRVSKMFMLKKLFITTNCEKLIWELQRYRWDKYDTSKAKNKNNLKETPLKKNDHAVDALRYGIMSRPEADKEVKFIYGNILGTSQIARDYDYAMIEEARPEYFDDTLGTDW